MEKGEDEGGGRTKSKVKRKGEEVREGGEREERKNREVEQEVMEE